MCTDCKKQITNKDILVDRSRIMSVSEVAPNFTGKLSTEPLTIFKAGERADLTVKKEVAPAVEKPTETQIIDGGIVPPTPPSKTILEEPKKKFDLKKWLPIIIPIVFGVILVLIALKQKK